MTVGKYQTINEVAEVTEEQLCNIKGIGPKRAKEILSDAKKAMAAAREEGNATI